MSNVILLVFEGETIEGQIFESIKKTFFPASEGRTVIKSFFCGEIFQLWGKVRNDADLDIVEVLKERLGAMRDSAKGKAKKRMEMRYAEIKNIDRKNVSEVHLFFDYDAHCSQSVVSQQENHQKALGLLNTFNDEFEMGKLWISYPMAEALKHCKKMTRDCFHDVPLYISDNKNYRKLVDGKSDYPDIKKYDAFTWHYLSAVNIQRAFCLVSDARKTVSDYCDIKSWFEKNTAIAKTIHEKQHAKFIAPRNATAALSPFPLFLLHYFGEAFFNDCKCGEIIKDCCFFCYQ